MTETAIGATKPKRKMMCLPLPTHKLVGRVAALKGMSITDTLYVVLREELRRLEAGDTWADVPAPFSIKPTYTEKGCEVLLWHPFTPTLILTAKESNDLAAAIHDAAEGKSPTLRLRTETRGNNVRVTRGGRCIHLTVDGDNAAIILPAAVDVADALISASVHAGPIPMGGAN